jgi:hypothetical protein
MMRREATEVRLTVRVVFEPDRLARTSVERAYACLVPAATKSAPAAGWPRPTGGTPAPAQGGGR